MLCNVQLWFEDYQLKKILLICSLVWCVQLAHAEENDANSSLPSGDNFYTGIADTVPNVPDTPGAQAPLSDSGLNVYDAEASDTMTETMMPSEIYPSRTLPWTVLNLELEQPEFLKPELFKTAPAPKLQSAIALIYDQQTQRPLYTKNANARAPIASITKLMTAMVVLDAMQPLSEAISIESSDIDTIKRTPSRLGVGTTFTRNEMLSLALMSSENRAASALARSYPGGKMAMVAAMNAKARELGMEHTSFLDPVGLSGGNVSTAQDLVKMVAAARNYPLIHQYTTATSNSVEGLGGRVLRFINTNPLVRNVGWNIGISKTGFINEAGRCLVMEANINQRSVIIVLLNSWGKRTRIGDANRIKRWMEGADTRSRALRRS